MRPILLTYHSMTLDSFPVRGRLDVQYFFTYGPHMRAWTHQASSHNYGVWPHWYFSHISSSRSHVASLFGGFATIPWWMQYLWCIMLSPHKLESLQVSPSNSGSHQFEGLVIYHVSKVHYILFWALTHETHHIHLRGRVVGSAYMPLVQFTLRFWRVRLTEDLTCPYARI